MEMEARRADAQLDRKAAELIQDRDRVTKGFFDVVTPRFDSILIQALTDVNGNVMTNINGIKCIVTNYYKKFPTTETITEDGKCARIEIWNSMQRKVTFEMNSGLTLPISDMELRNVVQNMLVSCCPGEDRLSIVFFQMYWDVIGDAVKEVCNHIIDTGVMPQGMATCLILMIP